MSDVEILEAEEKQMTSAKFAYMTTAALLVSMGPAYSVHAQPTDSTARGQAAQPGQAQVMPGMSMMGQGMMGGTSMGPMRGHMMRIMFAVADTDGDGALSFEEVAAVHKRIFDSVDANDDGKVTPDELRTFMQGQ